MVIIYSENRHLLSNGNHQSRVASVSPESVRVAHHREATILAGGAAYSAGSVLITRVVAYSVGSMVCRRFPALRDQRRTYRSLPTMKGGKSSHT